MDVWVVRGSVAEGAGAPWSPSVARWLPVALVGVICFGGLWFDRASLSNVPVFNDTVLHEQMVRFATRSLAHGHLPFTQWYPYLNLGSPQFLHYQGLGATVVGALGLAIGPNLAFRLSLYLLTTLWPIAIYGAGRVWGFSRWVCAFAALVAPLLVSVTHVGYEAKAYEWWGYGVWAQLCAAWALPFAWAWTWRALRTGRGAWQAGLLVATTCALHFETGYSAFAALVAFPLLVPAPRRAVLARLGRVAAVAVAAAAWVLVPLLVYSKWAAINLQQVNTNWARGYGARKVLTWLVDGQYLDSGRLPVLSVALALGLVAAACLWRREPVVRAVLVMFVLMLLVSWGPTTWGPLVDVIPGHADIVFRRFQIAVDLSAIYLIGVGLAVVGQFAWQRLFSFLRRPRRWMAWRELGGVALAAVTLSIALPNALTYQSHNALSVQTQLRQQSGEAASLNSIIDYVLQQNDGRVYAGLPWNWGRHFRFGEGPVYMYLADRDVAQISTQGWVSSPMEEPQAKFDESKLVDYQLLGVRYLLLPASRRPSIAATLLLTSGPYRLWVIPSAGYFSVVEVRGSINANKWSVAEQSDFVMRTRYFLDHVDLALNYGRSDRLVVLPTRVPTSAPGRVVNNSVQLADGVATASVVMDRPGSLVLSVSLDPGWQAFVDGRLTPIEAVAPALVSVAVPLGAHQVIFRYQGFRWYLPLALLCLVVTGVVWRFEGREPREAFTPESGNGRRRRRRRRRAAP